MRSHGRRSRRAAPGSSNNARARQTASEAVPVSSSFGPPRTKTSSCTRSPSVWAMRPMTPPLADRRRASENRLIRILPHGTAFGYEVDGGRRVVEKADAAALGLVAIEVPGLVDDLAEVERDGGRGRRLLIEQAGHCQRVFSRLEQLAAAVADVTCVFPIRRIADGTEQLRIHDIGETDDRVERGAQLVADARHQFAPGAAASGGHTTQPARDLRQPRQAGMICVQKNALAHEGQSAGSRRDMGEIALRFTRYFDSLVH